MGRVVQKCMRPALLLLACACAVQKPLPAANASNWAQGRLVHVPEIQCRDSSVCNIADNRDAGHQVAERELAAVGFRVTQSAGDDALEAVFTHAGRAAMQLQFRDAAGTFGDAGSDVDADHLDCYSGAWAFARESNYQCMIRELLRKATASQEVAARVQQAPRKAVATATPGQKAWRGKLAVLDLRTYSKDVTVDQARYFTDLVRSSTLKAAPGIEVMTRENILVLLQASGKKLEECEGECEVDTGRRIGADYIVTGEIQGIGKRLKIALRLHDTREGRLLGSTIASGNSMEELDDSTAKAVEQLYAQ